MSNYSQTTFFTPKDSLPTTNPAKTIFGAAYDVEFGNISTAIATKYDSTQIATSPVAFNLGSAAAPGVTFVGHTGTGLYSNSNGDLGLSSNGAAILALSTTNSTAVFSAGVDVQIGGNIGGTSSAAAYTVGSDPTATLNNGGFINFYGSTNATPSLVNIGTNGSVRLSIAANGGAYLAGATGASQGVGTLNAAGLYVNGVAVIGNATLLAANNTWTGTNQYNSPLVMNSNIVGSGTSFAYTIAANPNASSSSGAYIQLYGSTSGSPGLVTLNNSNGTLLQSSGANITISNLLTVNGGLTVNNALALFTDGAAVTGLLTVNGTGYVANFAAIAGQYAQINIQGNGNNTTNALSLYQYTDNNGYINSAAGSLNLQASSATVLTLSSTTVNVAGSGGFTIGGNPVYSGIPQNNQTSAYTIVLSDNGKHIQSTANITIPANSVTAFPVGAAVTFINVAGGNTTLSINSDSLIWSPSGATGSRTLAPYAIATALKTGATTWRLTGVGIT